MEYNHKFWVPEFNLKNVNLASLTSEAAVDISNIRLRERKDEVSVKYLSQLLNNLIQGENPSVKLPDNSTVLAYVISGREKFEEYWKEKNWSIDELVLQVNLVSRDLRDFKSLSGERQEILENFCVNLSRECMSYRRQCYSGTSRLVA